MTIGKILGFNHVSKKLSIIVREALQVFNLYFVASIAKQKRAMFDRTLA
jgi:hypothetical protein